MKKNNKKSPSRKEEALSLTLTKKGQSVKVITPLKDLVQAYQEAQARIKKLQDKMDPLKEAKEALKNEIIKTFKDRGEYSTRIEGATVSLSVRKTAIVVNEKEVVSQLKSNGYERYVVESISPEFDTLKKAMINEEMALLEGIEIKETEFISVRANEIKDPRKIVTGEYKQIERKSNGKN